MTELTKTDLTKTELTKAELTKTELAKTDLANPAELEVGRPLVLTEATLLPVAFREPLRPQRAPHRFSRRLVVTSVIAVALITAAGSYGRYYWTVGRFLQSTDDAYVQADSTIVAPKVSGSLSEVLVADNQPVKTGQPLAKIDDRDYAAALDQAKADVATAQADIDNVMAALKQQQAVISQARATVGVDQANLTFAEEDNARYEALANRGSGSVQNAQQALSRRDTARATLERDTAAVVAAEQQVGVLQAQLAKANGTLQHDQAVQAQAQLNLGYTNIVAPINGVVGNRSLRVGEYVQAGTQLMAVVPLDAVYVVANFEETQLAAMHAGDPASIVVDTYSKKAVKGHIDSIAPASGQEFALLPPDNATGNFTKIVQRIPVKIAIDPDDPLRGDLRPGMSVTATIDTAAAAPAAGTVQPSAPH
jgi:membrane fusion protein (multidrug efflux system)